jgi:Restriction alleviation protein Lar
MGREETLTECPFCGAEEASVVSDDETGFCCMCCSCFAKGPTATSKAGAVTAWEERA